MAHLELPCVFAGEVGDGGEAREGLLDELEAELLLEEGVVDLVEVRAAQVDQAFRFRSLQGINY